ncbi:16817_t:CDS:2, partial [Acaulospora colombiana]
AVDALEVLVLVEDVELVLVELVELALVEELVLVEEEVLVEELVLVEVEDVLVVELVLLVEVDEAEVWKWWYYLDRTYNLCYWPYLCGRFSPMVLSMPPSLRFPSYILAQVTKELLNLAEVKLRKTSLGFGARSV